MGDDYMGDDMGDDYMGDDMDNDDMGDEPMEEVPVYDVPADTLYDSDGNAVPPGIYGVDEYMLEYGAAELVDGNYVPTDEEPYGLDPDTDITVLGAPIGFMYVGDMGDDYDGEPFIVPQASLHDASSGMTYNVYELTADDNITDEDGNVLTGLYAVDADTGEAHRAVVDGEGYALDHEIKVAEVRDINFSVYAYAGTEEFEAIREEYSIMDNVEGFDWDDLQKVRVKTKAYDHDTDDVSTKTQVKFIEAIGDYDNNWDYFQYENDGGYVSIEQYPDSQELVVYNAFEPNADSYNLKESAVSASDYFNIRDQLIENHGDVILSVVPEFESVEVNILANEDIVVTNAIGDILYTGWFHSDDEPREDGRLYWNVTMTTPSDGDDWILSVGGLNQAQETAEGSGEYQLVAGGENATFATEYFHRDDMAPEAWSEMLVDYQHLDLPDGALQDAVAVGFQNWAGGNDGDGQYTETMQVVRLAPQDYDDHDGGVDWDWDSNVRIEIRLESTTVKQGNDVYSVQMNDFELFDASDEDVDKFSSTVEASEVLVDQLNTFELKASANGNLYLVNISSQEIFAAVTDHETWYSLTDPESGDMLAWIWDESVDQSDDGNAHVGYGIAVDMETITPEELASLYSVFEPASDDYSVDDVGGMMLVHWKMSDADGNVLHDYYNVEHEDADGSVLGTVGYDVENDLYVTYNG